VSDSQEAKLVHRVEPEYPDVAQQARVQGNVYLQVVVEEQGSVSDVKVIRGYSLLNEAAVNAVRQWKYSPTLLNGEAVPVIATVVVNFALPDRNLTTVQVSKGTLEGQLTESSGDKARNLPGEAVSIDYGQAETVSDPASLEAKSQGPSLLRENESEPTLSVQETYTEPTERELAQQLRNTRFEVVTLSPLSASGNKEGDRFTVKVLEPERFEGVLIEGEVVKSKAAGKVKGKSELRFAFDRLILANRTVIPIEADLLSVQNSQGVSDIDEEGHVIGRSSKRGDIAKTAISSGIGALIGGLLGGKKGAATGAAMGAATGLAVVFSTRGEDITFAPGSVFTLSVTTRDKKETLR
ncbi:energy transducer TonB, partial [Acidobacteria bacterium AH-259-D05]|nr:energy transducer TonB [Acidobacteria bacterium AH-259-D05]